MQHYPNLSAQEAALSAVNLAPVARPLEHSPPPEPSQAEALTSTHGLLILERTPDGVPSWLACKFCPVFGCKGKKNRKKPFLKLYRIPDQFSVHRVEGHLSREHHEQWEQFKDLDEQKKKEYFQGKTLPPPQRFHQRMEELRKAWGDAKPNGNKKRVRSSDAFPESSQRLTKRIKPARTSYVPVLPTISLSTLSLPSHQEDWIGRTAFESAETPSVQPDDGQSPHKLDSAANCVPRRYASLPGKNVYQHLRAILQRYSEPFSHDLQQPVIQTPVEPERHEDALTPAWNDIDRADFAARILFYLLRGIRADVAAALLKESVGHPRKEDVHGIEKPAALKTIQAHVPEKNGPKHVNGNQMNVGAATSAKECEAPYQTEQKAAQQTSKDVEAFRGIPKWKEFVRTTANSISIASVIALKRIMSNRECWAFVVTTRQCRVRKDSVEVLISLPQATSAPASVKLTAPSPRAAPVKDIDDHTKGSSADANGADIGFATDVQRMSEAHMQKEANDVISLIFSNWLVSDSNRNMPSDRGEEGMNEWVYERITMCLSQALVFLNESGGISKARESVNADVRNKPICKDWILVNPTDDASIELTRSIYSKCGPRLRDSEWQLEKQVITGLVMCYQKALSFTPVASFASTFMYAEAVLRKAIKDFEKLSPVARSVPRVPGELLHVVSVREGSHAVETIIGLLDLVYPQWPSRLIGVRSEISSGVSAKALETELIQALQERRGKELVVVDESMPEEERPIYPSQLARMTQDDFRKFVNGYIKEPAILDDKFVRNLLNQHEVVCLKEVAANGLNKSWSGYEDMPQLLTFVRGLELLWNRKPDSRGVQDCRFAGLVYDDDDDNCEVVDRDVEHIFNARTLMQVEQTEKLDQEGEEPQAVQTDLKDYLIRWGENWSNLLTVSAR